MRVMKITHIPKMTKDYSKRALLCPLLKILITDSFNFFYFRKHCNQDKRGNTG